MKVLLVALAGLAVAQAQFVGMRADLFNPLKNPNHPANVAFSNAMAIRSQFVWPGVPAIRNPWMPPIPVAQKPVASKGNEDPLKPAIFPGMAIRGDVLNIIAPAIAERKALVNDHVQKMIDRQAAAIPGWRPEFVNEKLKKIDEIKDQAITKRIEMREERIKALKGLIESGDGLEFGSVMKAMGKAHGKEMAEKQIEFQKQMIEKFDKPFLRPQIELAQLGISTGEKIQTQIFQNFKEKAGTLIKGAEFFIITRVANFTGDVLDIKVHIDSVKESVKNLTLARIEKQLKIRNSILEELEEVKSTHSSEFVKERIDRQVEIIKKGMSPMRPEEVADWVHALIKEDQDLAMKRIDAQMKMAAQQIEIQQAMAAKRIEMQKEIAGKAMEMSMDIAAQNIKLQQDIRKKAVEETKKVLEGNEILVANPEEVEQALEEIVDPVIEKQVEVAEKVQEVQQAQQVQQPQQVQQVQQVAPPFFMGPMKQHPFFG